MLRNDLTAVIIAAGKGTRLEKIHGGEPKCLTEVCGRPIIEWILSNLATNNIRYVIMVVGYRADSITSYIGNGKRFGLQIEFVENPEFDRPNGISALLGCQRAVEIADNFLICMSDHLVDPSIISSAIIADNDLSLLMIDDNISSIFDIDDATKVIFQDNKPIAIGKNLEKYNAVDTGVFRGNKLLVNALEQSVARGHETLSNGIDLLMKAGNFEVVKIPNGARWIDVDTPEALEEARRMIEENGFLAEID